MIRLNILTWDRLRMKPINRNNILVNINNFYWRKTNSIKIQTTILKQTSRNRKLKKVQN